MIQRAIRYVRTGRTWSRSSARRTIALWKAAFNELSDLSLVEDTGYSGEIFELTKRGFEIADLLKSRV